MVHYLRPLMAVTLVAAFAVIGLAVVPDIASASPDLCDTYPQAAYCVRQQEHAEQKEAEAEANAAQAQFEASVKEQNPPPAPEPERHSGPLQMTEEQCWEVVKKTPVYSGGYAIIGWGLEVVIECR